jgi:hypothetical protein
MNTEQQKRIGRFTDILFLADRPFHGLDAIRFLLGDKIGEGAYRAVYSFDMIPDTVIKVTNSEEPCNILEMAVWNSVKDTKYAKWFAPCLFISPEGGFLIQKRCVAMKYEDKIPIRIPSFFTDIKHDNWGFIDGKLVCHDYQFIKKPVNDSMKINQKIDWKLK